MQYGTILYVDTVSDADRVYVTAEDSPEPDAATVSYFDPIIAALSAKNVSLPIFGVKPLTDFIIAMFI